jgi:hypothetical protein
MTTPIDLAAIEARMQGGEGDCDTCSYVKLRGYEQPCCDCGNGAGSRWVRGGGRNGYLLGPRRAGAGTGGGVATSDPGDRLGGLETGR